MTEPKRYVSHAAIFLQYVHMLPVSFRNSNVYYHVCEEYGNEICIHPLDFALFARYLDILVSFILMYVDAVDIS